MSRMVVPDRWISQTRGAQQIGITHPGGQANSKQWHPRYSLNRRSRRNFATA
jgi:hypothetical protein